MGQYLYTPTTGFPGTNYNVTTPLIVPFDVTVFPTGFITLSAGVFTINKKCRLLVNYAANYLSFGNDVGLQGSLRLNGVSLPYSVDQSNVGKKAVSVARLISSPVIVVNAGDTLSLYVGRQSNATATAVAQLQPDVKINFTLV